MISVPVHDAMDKRAGQVSEADERSSMNNGYY